MYARACVRACVCVCVCVCHRIVDNWLTRTNLPAVSFPSLFTSLSPPSDEGIDVIFSVASFRGVGVMAMCETMHVRMLSSACICAAVRVHV